MNKQNWLLLAVTLALIGCGAGYLEHFRTHQKLGLPGVKTRPLTDDTGQPLKDDRRLEVVLPERVLDYTSTNMPVDEITVATLPPDTSFGGRLYRAPDGFELLLNVVLMGADRTSLHKPQFCLDSQGWGIDASASIETRVPLDCYPSSLPVVKLEATKVINGQQVRSIYVYWYAADGVVSASAAGYQRMWWMARDLLRTGILQRWAYLSCMAPCAPGQEKATFERVKKFLIASAPEIYLPPSQGPAQATAHP
jgi:hypothetical protein